MDQRRDIALTIFSAFIAMSVLALAVAFLRARRLAYLIQAFVVLQGVAMIGVQGVKHSPFASEQLAIFFSWCNLINIVRLFFSLATLRADSANSSGPAPLVCTASRSSEFLCAARCAHVCSDRLSVCQDIEILRPGCGGIPTLTYVRKFAVTLLFMFLSAVLFFLACGLRLLLKLRERRIDPQQVYADDLIVDEDEAEEIAAADGRPKMTRLMSVARTRTMLPPPKLSLRMRLSRFRRSPEWQDASQRLQHSWLILGQQCKQSPAVAATPSD